MLVTFFFPTTRSLVPVLCIIDSYVAFACLSVLQNVFNDSRPDIKKDMVLLREA